MFKLHVYKTVAIELISVNFGTRWLLESQLVPIFTDISSITLYFLTDFDSNTIICRLPDHQRVKIRLKLQEVKQVTKFTLKVLQSIIDLLNNACLVVVPGRDLSSAHHRLPSRVSNPSLYIRLTCEARVDLYRCGHFLLSITMVGQSSCQNFYFISHDNVTYYCIRFHWVCRGS